MRTRILPATLLLAACQKDAGDSADPKPDPPIPCDTVTDTVPAFCNEVPKNLIFLSMDTFRRDMLARYGGEPGVTPTLDRLAAEGYTLDENVQCSNWTFNSTTCTLLGQTGINAGWMPRLAGAEPVAPGLRLLPGYLAEAGFWSLLVSSNAWLSNTWGNGRDYNHVVFPGGGRITTVADNGLRTLVSMQDIGVADRWFLHLHALEPHAPYVPPDEYLGELATLDPIPWDLTQQASHYDTLAQWPSMSPEEQDLLEAHLRVRYKGEVSLLDDGIDQVLSRLDREGWLDDALVVIWTDHGEQFFEHGRQTHAHHLYGEENDTLAIFWAKNIVAGAHVEPTQSIDITPTLLGLYGLEIPPELDGIALGAAPEGRVRFLESDARQGEIQGVIADGWKLQFYWATGELVLTNPAIDPLEPPLDLDANAAKVNELWTLLEPRARAVEAIKGFGPSSWPVLP